MFKKFGVYLVILTICLALGIKTAIDTPLGLNTLVINLESSHTGGTELFYDNGEGFTAERRLTSEVDLVDVRNDLIFELPITDLLQLRWDPVYHDDGVSTKVHSVEIHYYGGEAVRELAFESIVPINHIKTFSIGEESVEFSVDGGDNDPYLLFTKIPEAPDEPSRTWLIVKGVLFSLLAAGLFSAVYYFLVRYFRS